MDMDYFTRQCLWPGASARPDRPAVSFEDGTSWNRRELHERTLCFAGALEALGVGRGERVGILLYNCLEFWPLYLGVTRLGAIAVRLNFRLASEELAFAIEDSGCAAVVFHTDLAERLEPVRARLPTREWLALDCAQAPAPPWARPGSLLDRGPPLAEDHPRAAPGDPAMLMYTSGTTGRPKGALWNHDNSLWFAAVQALRWRLDADTVALTTGPMYHVGAVEDLLSATLAVGGHAIVLRSGGFDLRRVLRIIAARGVTDVFLFPFMVHELVQLEDWADFELSSLRRVVCGGDPLLPWAIRRLHERYPWIELVQVYGLTEGMPIAACSTGEQTRAHPESVGTPMPFTEISLRDEHGRPVEAGSEGEIWVRSPVVCREYWNRPEANAETFTDGWCHTGDLGRLNEVGLLCVAGRKKDMIRSGGENIYPAEIEDVLMRHEGVREVAVVGIPDRDLIEIVCAVVVRKADAEVSAEDIVRLCREHLAGYKKPRHVVFRDALPRTPSGKLMKFVLREAYRGLGTPSPD